MEARTASLPAPPGPPSAGLSGPLGSAEGDSNLPGPPARPTQYDCGFEVDSSWWEEDFSNVLGQEEGEET